jgi:glycosyltransferase involved in cell wall biosynthesis
MKIAINALAANLGGMLTYLLNVIPEMINQDDKIDVLIILNKNNERILKKQIGESSRISYIVIKIKNPICRIIWENFFLNFVLIKNSVDILFCPIPPTPLICSIPNLVEIRNMAPYCKKFSYQPTIKEKIRYFYLRCSDRSTIKRANKIVFVSESSKEMLINAHKSVVDFSKFVLIYHGRNPIFTNIKFDNSMATKIGFPLKYILYISPTWHYKNHAELIIAFKEIKKYFPEQNLVIVGKTQDPYFTYLNNLIKSLGLSDSVHFVGNLPYEILPIVYNLASLMVYPSLVEACPNNLIEALSCNIPIIASDIPITREICGNAALYFNPFDPEDIANKIFLVLQDNSIRQNIIEESKTRAEKFSWCTTASKLLYEFHNLV